MNQAILRAASRRAATIEALQWGIRVSTGSAAIISTGRIGMPRRKGIDHQARKAASAEREGFTIRHTSAFA